MIVIFGRFLNEPSLLEIINLLYIGLRMNKVIGHILPIIHSRILLTLNKKLTLRIPITLALFHFTKCTKPWYLTLPLPLILIKLLPQLINHLHRRSPKQLPILLLSHHTQLRHSLDYRVNITLDLIIPLLVDLVLES